MSFPVFSGQSPIVADLSHEQTRKRSSESHYSIGVSSEPFSGEPHRKFPPKSSGFSQDVSPKRVKLKIDEQYLQWAVVTTVNAPTQSVNDLAQLSDWCLVVVGDKKTPEPCELPLLSGSYYLGEKEQKEFCSQFDDFCEGIFWNNFGRKNIGYLYAIAHGANKRWDFDDDNIICS